MGKCLLAHVILPITIFIKSSSYCTLYLAQHISTSYIYIDSDLKRQTIRHCDDGFQLFFLVLKII